MASSIPIPRFLLPRGDISKTTTQYLLAPRTRLTVRHDYSSILRRRFNSSSSSSSSSSADISSQKHRILEKPDKFRPPSHAARRVVQPRKQPQNYPGPAPSAKEAAEQKTRQYPNMFPPEGTVMFKFLTNKGIHVWISMSVLFSLATFTFTTNFKRTSPYAHLLPAWSQLLTSPFSTIGQFFSVMKMHAEHGSLITSEKRKRRVDDVDKRREYRIAHGLEKDENATTDDGTESAERADGVADGSEPPKRRPIKKWLGIW
ncbi:hypothetical protein FQN57_002866 [Myotisia sp. PD_48]|nr:hypothetical protein FQN57_002866 [Myotisia sp. PD_48]